MDLLKNIAPILLLLSTDCCHGLLQMTNWIQDPLSFFYSYHFNWILFAFYFVFQLVLSCVVFCFVIFVLLFYTHNAKLSESPKYLVQAPLLSQLFHVHFNGRLIYIRNFQFKCIIFAITFNFFLILIRILEIIFEKIPQNR